MDDRDLQEDIEFVLVSVRIYWSQSFLVFNFLVFESCVCYRAVVQNDRLCEFKDIKLCEVKKNSKLWADI